jgi:hypothetical protein
MTRSAAVTAALVLGATAVGAQNITYYDLTYAYENMDAASG